MATYTITLNERSARGKALMEYLQALGVLMHKVSPKSATKHRLYDPETGEYLNDETMKAIEDAHNGIGVTHYDSVDDMFKSVLGEKGVTHYDSVDDMFKSVLGEKAFKKLISSNV